MASDTVIIRDLLIRGIIGVNDWEREKKQDIVINLSLSVDARAAAVDGIAGRIGGHSLRVGSARELAADGASVAELQQAGGWKSPTTPGVYIRREAAARGPVARRRYKVGA